MCTTINTLKSVNRKGDVIKSTLPSIIVIQAPQVMLLNIPLKQTNKHQRECVKVKAQKIHKPHMFLKFNCNTIFFTLYHICTLQDYKKLVYLPIFTFLRLIITKFNEFHFLIKYERSMKGKGQEIQLI